MSSLETETLIGKNSHIFFIRMYSLHAYVILIGILSSGWPTQSYGFGNYDDYLYHDIDMLQRDPNYARNMPSELAQNKITPAVEKDSQFWFDNAQRTVKKRARDYYSTDKKAKNMIFFLGDGMSISTITAARILKGQREGRTGEETKLTMEEFPYAGLSKVKYKRVSCFSFYQFS